MLIIAPIQQAQAFTPYAAFPEFANIGLAALGGSGGADVAIAATGTVGGVFATAFGALPIGYVIGGMIATYVCDSGAVEACKVREPLSNNFAKQITPPSAPPSVTPVLHTLYLYNSISYPSFSEACDAAWASHSATTTANFPGAILDNNGTTCKYYTIGGIDPSYLIGSHTFTSINSTGCSTGYVLSGSTCTLSDARLVTPDRTLDIGIVGNINSILPDADTMAINKKPVISADGSNVKYAGYVTGSDGQKHMLWIDVQKQNLADASADLYRMQVSYIEHNMGACATDPACQSLGSTPQEITTQTLQVANGVVTGTATSKSTGSVGTAGDTYIKSDGTTGTVQPNELVVTKPDTTGKTTTPSQVADSPVIPQTQTIDFPKDYARYGEAGFAAQPIVDKLTLINDKLSQGDSNTPIDSDLPPIDNTPFINYFNPLRAWSMPVVAGTCPFGSFVWNGHTYSFDSGCTLFNNNLGIIRGAMSVVYSIVALFIVLSA